MKTIFSENLNTLQDLALAADERSRSLWNAFYAAKYNDNDTMRAHLMSVFHLTTDKNTRKAINSVLLNVVEENRQNS